MTSETLLLVLIGFFIPPVPIFLLDKTIFTKEFLVSVILTSLGHLPGVLFSIYYIVIEYPRQQRQRGYRNLDEESGNQGQRDHQAPVTHHSPLPASLTGSETPGTKLRGGYTDEPVQEPIAGSSDAPPGYDEVVTPQEQLHQGNLDAKRSGDHKVQQG